MVQMYTIAGRQIGSHYLAIATLTTMFTGVYFSLPSGAKPAQKLPPINASSSDEEDFIKKFMENAEAETKKEKH